MDAERFLSDLRTSRPGLFIVERDLAEPAESRLLRDLAHERGLGALGVPKFIVCDEIVVGFESRETTAARRLGLPSFTIALGFIDGFKPCAKWALLFILSLLASLQDRMRMALIGATLVVVSRVVYFGFMVAVAVGRVKAVRRAPPVLRAARIGVLVMRTAA